ncbi:hypothetical protein [Clostridium botulinum]|uniref:hypothetical protein n=1 Tax=Clostridium botulinum TaxID=1491 RepID=UPI001FD6D66B|nr:hypothetical protein [Clostridium botulinum]MCJ8173202.1 hypothetical protein [Clostridium botulinum]
MPFHKIDPEKEIRKAIEYFNGYGSPYDELVIGILEKQVPKKVIRTKTISQASQFVNKQ